jgi:hypothetical protein
VNELFVCSVRADDLPGLTLGICHSYGAGVLCLGRGDVRVLSLVRAFSLVLFGLR